MSVEKLERLCLMPPRQSLVAFLGTLKFGELATAGYAIIEHSPPEEWRPSARLRLR